MNGAGLVAEQSAEDVASECHKDRGRLFSENKALAEIATVVFGEKQTVKDCKLLSHLAEGIKGRHVLALVHTLDHPLEWRDHV